MFLQEHFAPKSICYGCGPANDKGLRIRSEVTPQFDLTGEVRARWKPEKHHEAFPGVLNGGVVGSLLDCHMNWTAAYTLMKRQGLDHPPCTVTADYHVKLKRPTPTEDELELVAKAVEILPDRAVIEAQLLAGGKVCATCRGTFVAVGPGHPAYYRW